ncbi:hypothetical protein JRI60_33080 [Archangium violaceum]|uniref:hypothetical protein n=1 Tax=Archangium violaceum TaxID=83451 RepID=UPI0019516205|nr:hypothetical protein [Archangium violaceum]QRN93967.1 hypothetical protein JRI60_33080 [Archangium violaceum]
MRRALLLLWGLTLGGCAWEPGQGFAVVQPSVRVAYEPLADRATSDGYQRLSSDYQVRVDMAMMRLSGIELLASAGGASGAFDPSNPPPGYSLCHGGHCHRDDGALIPYEQISAEMGGGGGSRTVVTLPVTEPLDLLSPEKRTVSCSPRCALPETQVSQGRWGVESLRLEGSVRDGRVPPRIADARRFRVDFAPGEESDAPVAILTGELDLPSDRSTPPEAKLDLDLKLTAALFDPLDWNPLSQDADGVVIINASSNPEAYKALVERLARFSPEAEVTRADP